MNESSTHKYYWSVKLLALLHEMAAKNTNAVLTLLTGVNRLRRKCKYPENGLLFADGRWRAFYHRHEFTSMHEKEHGHFHLFTDLGNQNWAHVAGLSIDIEGQPLQWFTVNRWVTDGTWLEVVDLAKQFKYITLKNTEESLVADWLGILVQLYGDDLNALLTRRDKQFQHELKGRSRLQALEDRDVYILSVQAIDITRRLEEQLLGKLCGAA